MVASQALRETAHPSCPSDISGGSIPPRPATRETNCRPELALHRQPRTYQLPPGGLARHLRLHPQQSQDQLMDTNMQLDLANAFREARQRHRQSPAGNVSPSKCTSAAREAPLCQQQSDVDTGMPWEAASVVGACRRERRCRVDTVTPWQLADAVGELQGPQRSKSEPPAMLTIRSFHAAGLLAAAITASHGRFQQVHTNGFELFNPGPSFQRRCQFHLPRRPCSASIAALHGVWRNYTDGAGRVGGKGLARQRPASADQGRSDFSTGHHRSNPCNASTVSVSIPTAYAESQRSLVARASVANPQKGFRTRYIPTCCQLVK
jgi:hypothetical protein